MERDIFLIGGGQTKFGEWWGRSLRDLIEEAVEAAFKDAPCTALDIDLVVIANMLGEIGSHQAQLGSLASSLLPHRPPAVRVESACASGAFALHTACAFLESGRAKTVLCIGAEKMTDASPDAIAEGLMGAADAEVDRPSGITFPGLFGLIAARYMHEYGLTRDDLSLVSTVHHSNACHNPFAQFHSTVTPEAVSRSPLVSDPLRLLDCSPVTDGAAACILSTQMPGDLRLRASQVATDTLSLTQRATLTSFSATKDAMGKALTEAEISRSEIGVLETHDCFSIAAIINMEDLGFAEPGRGVEIYRTLHRGKHAPFPVNLSGGLKGCGHPVAATGIKQLLDVGKALRKNDGTIGLAHNFGGAAATAAIHILERTHA
jgi:acetyl-CoA C-acetyltransferase